MSSYRSGQMNRRAAEQLLDGGPASGATRPLAAALRAAAVPAHPEELSGEQAAVAAFRDAAQLDPVPSPRRPSMLKSALAKILTVKAAVVLAAAGTSGVVLAATTGVLSTPGGQAAGDHRPAEHPPAAHSTSHTPAGTPANAGKPDQHGNTSSPSPSPSMFGLCQAYEAQVSNNPGKAHDNPAFTALVTAAGGKDDVGEYCDSVLAAKDTGGSHGKPTDLPTPENPGNGGAGDAGHPPADDPATPPSRGHAPDSPPATGNAESPNGLPTSPVAGR